MAKIDDFRRIFGLLSFKIFRKPSHFSDIRRRPKPSAQNFGKISDDKRLNFGVIFRIKEWIFGIISDKIRIIGVIFFASQSFNQAQKIFSIGDCMKF